jgi:hypothetical protein
MSRDVIFLGSSGLLQLGKRVPGGVQEDVEVFISLDRAIRWAKKFGKSPRFCFRETEITLFNMELIAALYFEGGPPQEDLRLALDTPPLAFKRSMNSLLRKGLIRLNENRVELTEFCREQLNFFLPETDATARNTKRDDVSAIPPRTSSYDHKEESYAP